MNVDACFSHRNYVLFMSSKNSQTNAKTLALMQNIINKSKVTNDSGVGYGVSSLAFIIPNMFEVESEDKYRDMIDEIIRLCKLDFPQQDVKYPILMQKTQKGPKVRAIGLVNIQKFYAVQMKTSASSHVHNEDRMQKRIQDELMDGVTRKVNSDGTVLLIPDNNESAQHTKEGIAESMARFDTERKSSMPSEHALSERAKGNKVLQSYRDGDDDAKGRADMDMFATRGMVSGSSVAVTTFGGDSSAEPAGERNMLDEYLRKQAVGNRS